jgi:hypothetical protein
MILKSVFCVERKKMNFETIFKILILSWAFTVSSAGVIPIRFEDNPEEGILIKSVNSKLEDVFDYFCAKKF